jgi:monovalent cation:H+ antiporter, CPA1 family
MGGILGGALTWGGLRGALPMVLVLSLPKTLVFRDLLISMTYGVALLSILLQRLSISGVLKSLGLTSERVDREAYKVSAGKLRAATAAMQEIERLSRIRAASPDILDDLQTMYRQVTERRRTSQNFDRRQPGIARAGSAAVAAPLAGY